MQKTWKKQEFCSKYQKDKYLLLGITAVFTTPTTSSPQPCTNALTHARPSLPVNQKSNPAPPNMYPVGLHDTAASQKVQLRYWSFSLFYFDAPAPHALQNTFLEYI